MSDTFRPIIVAPATSFNPAPGLNVSADTAVTTLEAEVAALGVASVRATVTTVAEEATLAALSTAGVKIDLVLAPGQSVSSFVSLATQLNATAPQALISLEGPDLVADPSYTYVSKGTTLSGDAAGDQATADLDQAAAAAGLGSIATINYSTSVANTATGVADTTYLNINPGSVALQEPDVAALETAQDNATIDANSSTFQYVVTDVGASSASELLDAVLDAEFVVGPTQTDTGNIVAPSTYLAAAAAGSATPLFNANGSLTATGQAYVNLDTIVATGLTGTSAGGTLALNVPQYEAGVQYADHVEVFAGPGVTDDIVWWGTSEAPNASGHGPSILQFGSVEASVTVFDPTQGTGAVASFSNISTLDVLNSPDGPLVVQVSNTAGTTGASSTGTYAGVVALAGGTSSGGSTTTGVTTTVRSTGTTYTTAVSGMNAVVASASSAVTIFSQGTDTITAGAGNDLVFASGPAATVTGSTGNLTFVAGAGNDVAGGGSGTDTLYGGSGTDALIGSSGVNNILVAGSGNTSLIGGAGSQAVMFGGSGINTFFGSTGGSDTMVGGTGSNLFTTTHGDIIFGGPASTDVYNLTGGELVVEGNGASTVNLDAGASTVFGGAGATTFNLLAGQGDNSAVIGFTASDHLTLVGVSSTDEATALASATTGSFGTILSLADGTKITLFGATLGANQVSTG